MQNDQWKWDFFLAHAGVDVELAESLYDQLAGKSRVFLDSRCLSLGDNWDIELASAQRQSLITVVLVSGNTTRSYYQREEVAAAIALAREASDRHRVVPIYVDTSPKDADIPYGLRLKHGISLGDKCTLAEAAIQLIKLLRSLEGKRPVDLGDTGESRPVGIASARGLEIESEYICEYAYLLEPNICIPIVSICVHNRGTDRSFDDVRIELRLPANIAFVHEGAAHDQKISYGHVIIPLMTPVHPGDSLKIGYLRRRLYRENPILGVYGATKSDDALEWKITARDVPATSGDLDISSLTSE